MALQALVCPQCGAPIKEADVRDVFYCSYCGTRIEREKLRVEVSGNVSVAGMANDRSLLDRAFLFLEDGNFNVAAQYIERSLDANPRSAMAYLAKIMVIYRHRNKAELIENCVHPLESDGLFRRALRFADEAERAELMDLQEKAEQRHNEKLEEMQRDIDRRAQELAGLENERQGIRLSPLWYTCGRILIVILFAAAVMMLLAAVCGPFFAEDMPFIGTVLILILVALPCIAAIIGLIIWWRRLKEKKKKQDEFSGKIALARTELDVKRIKHDETKTKWDVLKREAESERI